MQRLGHFLPQTVAALLRKAPLTDDKIAFAWKTAVGSALGNATTIAFGDGVLRVRAKDAAWQREVERAAGLVRSRLDAILGPGVVRSIEVIL